MSVFPEWDLIASELIPLNASQKPIASPKKKKDIDECPLVCSCKTKQRRAEE